MQKVHKMRIIPDGMGGQPWRVSACGVGGDWLNYLWKHVTCTNCLAKRAKRGDKDE
jgi:hypothetical protein